jgi:twinkle protein
MRTRCPKCKEEGSDTKGNGVKIYDDGNGYCFKCRSFLSAKQLNGESMDFKRQSSLTISQVQTYPIGTSPERNISEEVAALYGVRYSADSETGKPSVVYYPTHDNGNVTGYKVRKLPKDFTTSVGAIGKKLFGNHLAGKGDFLLLTEGEEDCLAVAEMLTKPNKVDVMSMPDGAGLSKDLKSELVDLASKYKRVYLCFDNDKPGLDFTEQVADFLSTITQTRIISLDPALGKDASDYWQNGSKRAFSDAVANSKIHEPEGIVNGTDINLDDLLTPMPDGYPVPFDGLQDKLHGVRKGEILTVCAGSGIGKSTLVREIALSLIEQGLSVANIALEDQMNVAAQALIALDMNIPLPIFRVNPPDKSDVQPHYDKVVGNGKTYFYKHFAGITSESLMNKLYYYARAKQVDFIILDHLSMVISSSDSNNERKDIDKLMTELARMVVETGVGLIQIVHLKRTSGDKSYAQGGEVELTDLRGSAALEQLSWAVVGLERDQQGDDRDFSKARVLKNRTWGFTGLADSLKFDTSTGRMFSFREPLEEVDICDTPLEDMVPEEPLAGKYDDILQKLK